jgi:hypothetical protein
MKCRIQKIKFHFKEKDLDKPGWRVYNNKSPEGGTAGKQPIDTPMPKVGGV